MPATTPAATLAKLFNLTERHLRDLARDGTIPKGEHGKYELGPCVQGYVRYLQQRAQGRAIEGIDTKESRARLLEAQANKTELEVRELSGELLSTAAAQKAWGVVLAAFRSRLLILPTKLAPSLLNQTDAVKIEETIRTQVYEALHELANFTPARGRLARPNGDAGDSPPAAKPHHKRMGRPRVAAKRGGLSRARAVPQ